MLPRRLSAIIKGPAVRAYFSAGIIPERLPIKQDNPENTSTRAKTAPAFFSATHVAAIPMLENGRAIATDINYSRTSALTPNQPTSFLTPTGAIDYQFLLFGSDNAIRKKMSSLPASGWNVFDLIGLTPLPRAPEKQTAAPLIATAPAVDNPQDTTSESLQLSGEGFHFEFDLPQLLNNTDNTLAYALLSSAIAESKVPIQMRFNGEFDLEQYTHQGNKTTQLNAFIQAIQQGYAAREDQSITVQYNDKHGEHVLTANMREVFTSVQQPEQVFESDRVETLAENASDHIVELDEASLARYQNSPDADWDEIVDFEAQTPTLPQQKTENTTDTFVEFDEASLARYQNLPHADWDEIVDFEAQTPTLPEQESTRTDTFDQLNAQQTQNLGFVQREKTRTDTFLEQQRLLQKNTADKSNKRPSPSQNYTAAKEGTAALNEIPPTQTAAEKKKFQSTFTEQWCYPYCSCGIRS